MSRFNLFFSTFVILVIFLTQPLFAQDQLGVFFDAEGTVNSVTTSTPYSQVSAWVQLVDPSASEALTAFEFRVEVHTDGPDPILSWTLPDQALNIEAEPVFMVGLGTPMIIQPRMTLAEVVIFVPEAGQTVWLTLHPLEEPSLLDPPGYGYPVCSPLYAIGSDNEMMTMTVITGCDSDPVASINSDGNPPEIQIGGLPPSLTLQKDSQGKQIEFITLHNEGEVSFSGQAFVSGTTPMQFEIDGNYYTNGPINFQVPVGGTIRISPYYEGGGSVDATIELEVCHERWSIPVGNPNEWLECVWSVESLDFGDVEIGQSEVQYVELTNTGYESFPIETYYEIPHFLLQKIQHPGGFLAIGQSCTYRVTFTPFLIEEIAETLTIGAQICSLNLTGTGLDGPPLCQVSMAQLNWAGFIIGSNPMSQSFTVKNVGGGILEGEVTLNDSSGFFALDNNCGGAYSLASNESKSITVIFDPEEAGSFSAEIDLGLDCGIVPLGGHAIVLAPQCFVSVPTLNFGEAVVGAPSQNKSFMIRNTGGGVLEGHVFLNDATGVFRINSYASGPFSLGPNQTRTVGVYFNPEEEGSYTAEVSLGLECGSVSLVGSAVVVPPQCAINVTELDFGDFVIGQGRLYRSLRITNIGGGLMEGAVTLGDTTGAFALDNYSAADYSLAHNQSRNIYVFFYPQEAGSFSALLNMGSVCGSIPLSGTAADLAPQCLADNSGLVFDEQIVGGYAQDRYFFVKNIGGGLLEGTVEFADTTSSFSLQNYAGNTYSLTYNQQRYFSVEFHPGSAGDHSIEIELGADCGSLPVSGAAVELDPECELVSGSLQDGVLTIRSIPVGGSRTSYLGIRNIGGGYLNGELTMDDPSGVFQIVGSNQYSLHSGESAYLSIKFTPQEVGTATAVLNTGALCGDIIVTAEGEESYAYCHSYFFGGDLERVAVGDTVVTYVYLGNSGYLELEGDLQVEGEGFQFENPGPFTLEVGEWRYEELYFIPETVDNYSAVISTGLSLCPGDWEISGFSVPAGSDQMGFYFDSEGIENTMDTDQPKVRQAAYLVLHNPSAEGQLAQWYVNFWAYGSAMVMDDWNSLLPGGFYETSYRKRLYLESPVPYAETMVLADFTVLITDPNEASSIDIGYAFYQDVSNSGLEYVLIHEPVNLVMNAAKSELKKLPATPVAVLGEDKVLLEWPCGPKNFEGFHVYRRVNQDQPERLTTEPLVFTEYEGRYEDTNLPEAAFEVHYYVTSLFKGVESEPGVEVTLELVAQETEIPVPTQTRLLAIYPNPFNPETNISFEIAQPGRVQIKIYDVGGRLVRNLTDQHFDSGHFEETWNGRDDAGRSLPSNVYYARMVAGSIVQMRKMTLLK